MNADLQDSKENRTKIIVNDSNKLTIEQFVIANEVKQSHEIAASLRSSQ